MHIKQKKKGEEGDNNNCVIFFSTVIRVFTSTKTSSFMAMKTIVADFTGKTVLCVDLMRAKYYFTLVYENHFD